MFPSDEKFALTSQIRRATNSKASNFAEGTSRITRKEKARFYSIAFSTTMEVLNHLILSKELDFSTEENYLKLRQEFVKYLIG
ncbi:four helix bundle protein [Flavicella sediminum]|uniref:four helix bundle protein n=1 Tax=Flavicella sediminum TaxID=2585141 RepID=UPI0029390CAC|nr:four helix bundle protein [Flavicella sediminum]